MTKHQSVLLPKTTDTHGCLCMGKRGMPPSLAGAKGGASVLSVLSVLSVEVLCPCLFAVESAEE